MAWPRDIQLRSLHIMRFDAEIPPSPAAPATALQMICVQRGSLRLRRGRKTTHLRPNQMTLLPARSRVKLYSPRPSKLTCTSAVFRVRKDVAQSLLQEVVPLSSRQIALLNQALNEQHSSLPAARTISTASFAILLATILRQYMRLPEAEAAAERAILLRRTATERTHMRLASSVKKYLLHHYAEPLTLKQIAQAHLTSPSHLSRIYRAVTGRRIFEQLARIRIEKAKQLLTESELSIAQIGRAVGYPCLHHFSRRFRQLVGVPPSRYLRTRRASDKSRQPQ